MKPAQGPKSQVDVTTNRKIRKWTRREMAGRFLWWLVSPAFALSPRPFWAWRRALLRLFGAKVGSGAHLYPSARITIPWHLDLGEQCAVGDCAILYALGPILIGPRTTISQGAHLCAGTHDVQDPARRLLKPPIEIGADVWVAADAFIGPGVTVGDGAIVGARAVVMKDVAAYTTVVGNPAKPISFNNE